MRSLAQAACPVYVWIFVCGLQVLSGCSNDVPAPFNCDGSDLSGMLTGVVNASGCNTADGSLSVAASGGAEPYRFSVNNGASQSSGEFTNLGAGIYSVTITDNNDCSTFISNINMSAADVSVVADVQADNLCIGGDGTVTISVSEGSPPYLYRKKDEEFGESPVFSGLDKGDHMFEVRDDAGCTMLLNVTVPQGQTNVSWAADVLPIVESSCAINQCHDGIFRPDLTEYDIAFQYAHEMKELTQTGAMPFEGSITQDQIDLIACWVDDGARDN